MEHSLSCVSTCADYGCGLWTQQSSTDTSMTFPRYTSSFVDIRLQGSWLKYWKPPWNPGAPLTYFNDGGPVRQRFICYTPKNPNFRICLLFFSIPQKIPQLVFLHQQILLFIFWKAKTCQLQLWFRSKNKTIQKQIRKARLTVIASLHPIFCDNFTGRYSLWHLQELIHWWESWPQKDLGQVQCQQWTKSLTL